MTTALRENLPPVPPKMRGLPVDERGYPVPFFVAFVNGKPDHRVVDPRAVHTCIRLNRCWLCGEPLGRYKVFTVGPMCALNRVSGEPPSHLECAEFAAKACPFLSRPNAKRREANLPEERRTNEGMLAHNPGVTLLWTTTDYKPFRAGGGILYDMGPPDGMQWYAEGRPATRIEVDAAIALGLPALRRAAEADGEGHTLDEKLGELLGLLDKQFATAGQ
jgi:hypothetical protein